jgi:hypothetical protein
MAGSLIITPACPACLPIVRSPCSTLKLLPIEGPDLTSRSPVCADGDLTSLPEDRASLQIPIDRYAATSSAETARYQSFQYYSQDIPP